MENIDNLDEATVDSVVEDVIVETPVEVPSEDFTPAVDTVVDAPVVEEQEVIGRPQYSSDLDLVESVGITETGAIGVTQEKREPKKQSPKAKKESTEEKIALFSTRNVTWPEVGKVYRGYNIVSKKVADQWLTRDHIRVATAEEVAKAFGK
jgi:hypothetical protein